MIRQEIFLFLQFFRMGIILTIFYDLFVVLRKVIPHNWVAEGVEDILFWLCTGYYVVFKLFTLYKGGLEWYFFLGAGVGIIIYLLTLHKIFINIMSTILEYIVVHIMKLLYIVFPWLKSTKNGENKAKSGAEKSFHNSKK